MRWTIFLALATIGLLEPITSLYRCELGDLVCVAVGFDHTEALRVESVINDLVNSAIYIVDVPLPFRDWFFAQVTFPRFPCHR